MSQLAELEALLSQMAESGCPASVLSYGFAAQVGSLMADELIPFFDGSAGVPCRLKLTDVILAVGWSRLAYRLVVDLDTREFSMISTLPVDLQLRVVDVASRAGYAVTQ